MKRKTIPNSRAHARRLSRAPLRAAAEHISRATFLLNGLRAELEELKLSPVDECLFFVEQTQEALEHHEKKLRTWSTAVRVDIDAVVARLTAPDRRALIILWDGELSSPFFSDPSLAQILLNENGDDLSLVGILVAQEIDREEEATRV